MSVFNFITPAHEIANAAGDYKHFEIGIYSLNWQLQYHTDYKTVILFPQFLFLIASKTNSFFKDLFI